MIGETRTAPDLDLLRVVREAVGPGCPVAASFDLHANMAEEISGVVDIAIDYKTYPHIDIYETAQKALGLLVRTVAGEIRPAVTIVRTGLVLLSHNMRTASGPMAEIAALAREMEDHHGFHDLSPFGGFTFGDSPHAGASVGVTAETGDDAAQTAAQSLCAKIVRRRKEFLPDMQAAADAVRDALDHRDAGTVAILEPADNPMSGGIGDTPGLFRALVAAGPDVPSLFAFFCDPELLDRARAAGEGSELEARLGGRLTDLYGPPVESRLRVLLLTDGRFVNDGPMWRGMAVDLGGSALFQLTDNPMIQVIVTGACISPNDHAYFRLHGIDLADIRILAAKAKNHFRAAFADTCARIVDVDTPGPATADTGSLPFRHVTRAMLPPWPGLDGSVGAV
jgi:microcystin degradation protein MlrC